MAWDLVVDRADLAHTVLVDAAPIDPRLANTSVGTVLASSQRQEGLTQAEVGERPHRIEVRNRLRSCDAGLEPHRIEDEITVAWPGEDT
jgi:hypothetical protein